VPVQRSQRVTERRGQQICEFHWLRHKDENDSFDLFDEFKFRRPEGIPKPVAKKNTPRCACSRELLPGRKFCTACAAKRERERKKRAYYERKKSQTQPIEDENVLRCRQCGGQRKPNIVPFNGSCNVQFKTIFKTRVSGEVALGIYRLLYSRKTGRIISTC